MTISKRCLSGNNPLYTQKGAKKQGQASMVKDAINDLINKRKIKYSVENLDMSGDNLAPDQELGSDSDSFNYDTGQFKKLDQAEFIQYASDMELARFRLLELLINNPGSLGIIAEEYLTGIEEGIDQSEMFSLKYGKQSADPVQNDDVVQVNAKEFGSQVDQICRQIKSKKVVNYSDYQQQMMDIHFLPIFLQRVVNRVMGESSVDKTYKALIHQQLALMLDARQIIINSNLRMVAFIVNKYGHNKISFSDLMQEGTIGLIKAVDRFDYLRPVKFSTYAVYWIRQMISRTITKQKKLVSLPFNLATKISSVFASINSSLQERNKWPTSSELAKTCQLSIKEIESILEFYRPCISLSSSLNDDDNFPTMLDTLEQHHFASPLNDLTSNKLQTSLKQALNSLSDREAYVIRTRFGLNTGIELTLQDIAEQINVSKERVRQIQNTALTKLREKYGSELGDFLLCDGV